MGNRRCCCGGGDGTKCPCTCEECAPTGDPPTYINNAECCYKVVISGGTGTCNDNPCPELCDSTLTFYLRQDSDDPCKWISTGDHGKVCNQDPPTLTISGNTLSVEYSGMIFSKDYGTEPKCCEFDEEELTPDGAGTGGCDYSSATCKVTVYISSNGRCPESLSNYCVRVAIFGVEESKTNTLCQWHNEECLELNGIEKAMDGNSYSDLPGYIDILRAWLVDDDRDVCIGNVWERVDIEFPDTPALGLSQDVTGLIGNGALFGVGFYGAEPRFRATVTREDTNENWAAAFARQSPIRLDFDEYDPPLGTCERFNCDFTNAYLELTVYGQTMASDPTCKLACRDLDVRRCTGVAYPVRYLYGSERDYASIKFYTFSTAPWFNCPSNQTVVCELVDVFYYRSDWTFLGTYPYSNYDYYWRAYCYAPLGGNPAHYESYYFGIEFWATISGNPPPTPSQTSVASEIWVKFATEFTCKVDDCSEYSGLHMDMSMGEQWQTADIYEHDGSRICRADQPWPPWNAELLMHDA